MRKSDAVRIAEIQKDAEMARQVVRVLCDPLWSSILGFVIVHEARRANLVGPVADDLLYTGIIAINSTRAGITKEAREGAVGLAEAATKTLSSAGQTLTALLPALV